VTSVDDGRRKLERELSEFKEGHQLSS
jgi:hypothetical protein